MKWQRLLSLSIVLFIIVFFVVINNGVNNTEDKKYSSIRFKVKANVESRHSFALSNVSNSASEAAVSADQETKSDDMEELLGFDDTIKTYFDSEQYQDTGEMLDPDSEQLDEEVVHYQDTGDFMDPDSEQLDNETPIYQDTGGGGDASNLDLVTGDWRGGEKEIQDTGDFLNPDEGI